MVLSFVRPIVCLYICYLYVIHILVHMQKMLSSFFFACLHAFAVYIVFIRSVRVQVVVVHCYNMKLLVHQITNGFVVAFQIEIVFQRGNTLAMMLLLLLCCAPLGARRGHARARDESSLKLCCCVRAKRCTIFEATVTAFDLARSEPFLVDEETWLLQLFLINFVGSTSSIPSC